MIKKWSIKITICSVSGVVHIVAFFAVNTLPIAGSVQERHIVCIFYNPLTLGMTMWSDLRAGNI